MIGELATNREDHILKVLLHLHQEKSIMNKDFEKYFRQSSTLKPSMTTCHYFKKSAKDNLIIKTILIENEVMIEYVSKTRPNKDMVAWLLECMKKKQTDYNQKYRQRKKDEIFKRKFGEQKPIVKIDEKPKEEVIEISTIEELTKKITDIKNWFEKSTGLKAKIKIKVNQPTIIIE